MNNLTVILQFLLVTSFKTTCILALMFVGLWLLRHSSASLRHWLLNISLMAVLALPIFTWLMPVWSLAILPGNTTPYTSTFRPTKSFDDMQRIKYPNEDIAKSSLA